MTGAAPEAARSTAARAILSALAVLVALIVSFLAGRATMAAQAQARSPAVGAAATTPSTEPPPWSTRRFREDDSVEDICVQPSCNG